MNYNWMIQLTLVLILLAVNNLLAEDVPPARQKEILKMLRQDCGSCHGLKLNGGLGLPLTKQSMKERAQEELAQTILHGRKSTAMPPWNQFLTEKEAMWLAKCLKEGCGE